MRDNHYAIEYWWENRLSPLLDLHCSTIVVASSPREAREQFARDYGTHVEITGTKELVLIERKQNNG
jgi:hypothetical protein